MGKGQISVSIGEALEREIGKLAKAAKRSLSEMIKILLEEQVPRKKTKK